MKKLVSWGLLALVIWWAVKDPTAAAHLVHDIGDAFNSVSTIANGS